MITYHKAIETNDKESGFTLVEMLVALCIVGLISGLMAAALMQLRPMRAITENVEVNTELNAVAGYIEGILLQSRKLVLLQTPLDRTGFVGNTQEMRFVTVVRIGADRSSLREVRIFARDLQDGKELVQENTPRRLPPTTVVESVIASKLKNVSFTYWDDEVQGDLEKWTSGWSNDRTLPAAVKITLSTTRFGRETVVERLVILKNINDR
jgi:prepilin-type N-terminal cleavage/methylation domain-containing protein